MSMWKQLKSVFAGAGVLAILWMALGGGANAKPQALDSGQLSDVRGGQTFFCVTKKAAPASQRCDACLSNGNARYIKCTDATAADDVSPYVPMQTPAQVWSLDPRFCNWWNTAITYNASTCTGTVYTTGSCARSHQKATAVSGAGVTCSNP